MPARFPTPDAAPPAALPPAPGGGGRIVEIALALALVLVLGGLWAADRALVRGEESARQAAMLRAAIRTDPVLAERVRRDTLAPAARQAAARAPAPRLRLAVWALGLGALGAVALGLSQERRLARRVVERSAELERLSAELIRVNRAKSEFLANVSHELRTPLNAIVGFVDLLQDGVYGELAPRQAGPVARIAGSASHLRELVDQILDLAKIAAGRLEVHTEPLQLRPFVLEVAAELEPLVQEKGLALSLQLPAGLPRVQTDATYLRQILVNLLGNAVKFTPAGRIAVRAALARRRDARTEEPRSLPARLLGVGRRRVGAGPAEPAGVRWVALQVIDTGIGIPAAALDRIFDEFEQVGPRTGDASVRGTGLGLAISRRLARLLGGDLTAESEVGQGATFTLWLRADEQG